MSSYSAQEASPVDKLICSSCVGEAFLKAQIKRNGQTTQCSYCNRNRRRCFSIDQMATLIERAFESHFVQTAHYDDGTTMRGHEWVRDGDPVIEVVQYSAKISLAPAEDILSILQEKHYDFDAIACGEECPFDADSYYRTIEVDDYHWHVYWQEFERSLRTENHFFNKTAIDHLGKFFQGIDNLTVNGCLRVVEVAGPRRALDKLYRARVFHSEEPLKNALARPDTELGPPPPRFASSGRMNAHGISVFYGANYPEVCIAEVRPPVGSTVAVARFEILHDLRLLNLDALSSIAEDGSYFDPNWSEQLARISFLKSLCNRMTRPVMPHDEPWEYLTTQAVADYLSTMNEPTFDGLIFPSVQYGNDHMNVVLFQKASRVQPLDVHPDSQFDFTLGGYPEEEGFEPWYHVRVTEPHAKAPEAPTQELNCLSEKKSFRLDTDEDSRPFSLRVDVKNIEIHKIESVEYRYQSFPVHRNDKPYKVSLFPRQQNYRS